MSAQTSSRPAEDREAAEDFHPQPAVRSAGDHAERRRADRRAARLVPEVLVQAGSVDGRPLRLAVLPERTVSVVVPALNEARNIGWVLQRLTDVHEVIVVDGMSTDGTAEAAVAARPGTRVVSRPPTGKGDALRAGFAAATGDVIVMIDADGSMDPGEIELFLAVMRRGYDVVKGSREMCGGGSTDLTVLRRLGNRALLGVANRLYRGRWTDFCYGYIAFRRDALPRLALDATGFEIEAQILTHAAKAGLRVAEVPSLEQTRLTGVSNLHPFRDGLRVARAIVRPCLPATSRRVPQQVGAQQVGAQQVGAQHVEAQPEPPAEVALAAAPGQ